MKTAISLPDKLFAAAERLADHLGLSRSQLYQRALAAYLDRHGADAVTARLDRVHAATHGPHAGPDDRPPAGFVQEDW